ncbi:hypothetical protein OIU85_026178 [Salix viminalis]|uniref:Uncharacterized protein n=1 Tax=Salix viminalis TaxID=40686 RepID=A0A9Q0TN71_SALVM|nr:hypothetical protein OIU85_026178 [Salix viminalis]
MELTKRKRGLVDGHKLAKKDDFVVMGQGGVDIAGFASIYSQQDTWTHRQQQQQQQPLQVNSFASKEPTSALHMRRSQSPPTSVSTLSSSSNGGAGGNTTSITATGKAVNPVSNERKDEWATELQPIPSGLEFVSSGERCGLGLEDWEDILSEPSQEQSLLRWIAGDVDDTQFGLKQLLQSGNNQLELDGNAGAGGVSSICSNLAPFPGPGVSNAGSGLVAPGSFSGLVNYKNVGFGNNYNSSVQSPVFSSPSNSVSFPISLSPGMVYHHNQPQHIEASEEKPHILDPHVLMNQQQSHNQHTQNPNLFLPPPFSQQENRTLHSQLKRHNSGVIDPISHVIPKLPISDPWARVFAKKTTATATGVSTGSSVSSPTTSTEAIDGEEGRFRSPAPACFVGSALQGSRVGRVWEFLTRARDIGAAQSTTQATATATAAASP